MQNSKATIIKEVPIFPLPNLVFFPKTLLPIHVFENRYLKMVKDALSNNNLICIVLLKDGWEKNYFGTPNVYDIACLGKIQQTEKMFDGKYNIMLYGMTKVKIIKFVQQTPYRIAQVKYLRDVNFQHDEINESNTTSIFINLLRRYLIEVGVKNLDELLKLQTHSLESIVNQVASILDFSVIEKQKLLEIDNLQERYEKILELLQEKLFAFKIARNVKYVPTDPSLN